MQGWTHPTLARHGGKWVIWSDKQAAKQKEEAEKEYTELIFFVQNHLATQLTFTTC